MTSLAMPAVFVAALLLGLWLRSRRLRRKVHNREGVIAELRADLTRAQSRVRYLGLQMAAERRRTQRAQRQAAKDIAEWKGIARASLVRAVEQKEQHDLELAVSTVEDGLRKAAAEQ